MKHMKIKDLHVAIVLSPICGPRNDTHKAYVANVTNHEKGFQRLLFSDEASASWHIPRRGQQVPALNKTQSSGQSAGLI